MCLGKVDNFGHNQSFHPIPLQTPALCGSVKGDVIILSKSATPQFIRILITTMESCTAGQIASLLTDTSGSSAIIEGAFVTYSNDAKIQIGVSEKIINEYGVYSKETAAEIAMVCREFYDADIGIGVTGTFGNVDPKNKDSAPGEVFFAVSTREGTESFYCEVPEQPSRLYYKLYMANVIVDEINKKVR